MSQEDNPERLAPPVDKVPPEAVALRAQPRPVKRLSRRTLAALVGGLAVAVLGATIWSLRPPERRERHGPAELYNVDRVSRSEGLESLPTDYSQLPPTSLAHPPELGPPLPGDLGPAIPRKGKARDSADIQHLSRTNRWTIRSKSSRERRNIRQSIGAIDQDQPHIGAA